MKRLTLLGLVGVIIVVLTGCAAETGTVVSKTHEDKYFYQVFRCQSTATSGCAYLVPITIFVPECWKLELREGEENSSRCVSESTWESLNPGDYYAGEVN